MRVKFFVQCDERRIDEVIEKIKEREFECEYRSKIQPGIIIVSKEAGRHSELENIQGIVRVWGDGKFTPTP